MEIMEINKFFGGKRIFITGHTGFKGSWLTFFLDQIGSITKGYSLKPKTHPSLYSSLSFSKNHESVISDIRDGVKLYKEINSFQPDYIFHLAAQPLVIDSYSNPRDTFEINFNGTLNLLECIKDLDLNCSVIFVTTDKVYENQEYNLSFKETDKLGGKDPYSASKSSSEILINSYLSSFFYETETKIASVRAGNVIGGGDWSENRLIPDLIRSIFENKKLVIRNPESTRPWQHVLESINGYIKLAIALSKGNSKFQGAWNFGPENGDTKTVKELIDISRNFGFEFDIKIEKNQLQKEAKYLSLNINKAKENLNWKPKWNSKEALYQTLNWYKEYYNGANVNSLLINEIEKYNNS